MEEFLLSAGRFFETIWNFLWRILSNTYEFLERVALDRNYRRDIWFNIKVTIFTFCIICAVLYCAFHPEGFKQGVMDIFTVIMAIIIMIVGIKMMISGLRNQNRNHH